jgi:acyl carrier protein
MSQSPVQVHSKESIAAWLVHWIAKELGLPPEVIETEKSLLDYSLSSVTAMMLVGDLEERLGLTLPPTLVWDYPSIAAIADFLTEQLAKEGTATSQSNGDVRQSELSIPAAADPMFAVDDMSDQEVTALLNQLMADEGAQGLAVS